ncbi:MAG: Grx4 family monothiol glutaredoxin [Pseudomonadota bacterium]|jgi:monothiol glutaredoxin|nr:Grx4 family monothiol glutaredoxin [Pseudomonadota bacterium]MEC8234542.1 Grx4 family monothiol glutaredoxin [Pseudomonadota bacterium]MEC8751737.1 Grx4 family monothiol glutaredoxin [Pseudomonadota bacterium]MEE3007601.1 Grx4 family monothiol glutaredoxin [Pseudomonadota bacterium]|tara:strand:- start:190 stop:531 length:342 start_codon:yes stop_codon:yes gene_type:complete
MMDENTRQRIQTEVDTNDVLLFMKGTPVFPQCGFSAAVIQVLSHLQVKFNSVNVLEDMDIREGIKHYSDWPTIPQLYVKGEFVGGCDIIREMFETGELSTFLAEKGIELSSEA